MNWVTIVWSLAAGACLTLAVMHSLIWLRDRTLYAHLAFAFAAIGTVGVAFCELLTMFETDPKAYLAILRWAHLPTLSILLGLAYFVRLYFQTGWLLLFYLAVGTRLGMVVVNFQSPGNISFLEIQTLKSTTLWGQSIHVIDRAIQNPWQALLLVNVFLFLVYFIQASLALWKRKDRESRRRSGVVGGSLVLFLLLAAGHSSLINRQLIESPFLITFSFMAILAAMAYQLSRDVVDAARLARDLNESQEQMTLAASAAKLALWRWDVPENDIWVMPAGRSMYGVSAHEKVSIERFLETVHPEDRDAVRQSLQETMAGKETFDHDYRIILAQGQIRWITAKGKMEFATDGSALSLRGVSKDVTDRFQAEERSRLVVEAAPYAMIMVNDSSKMVMVNQQTERTFGYTRAELIGHSLEILMPERFRAAHGELQSTFHQSPTARMMGEGRELSGLRKDGVEIPIEVGLTPIVTTEGRFVLASVSDISERKRLEIEARNQRDELTHLSRVSSLGLLSGSLAHEINQPLGIILANAQAAQRMLRSESPDLPELRDILDDIVGEDLRAGEAIKRLRALLKRGQTQLLPVNINEIVKDILRLTQSDLIRQGVSVSMDLDPTLPATSGDYVQLQQVVLNLILNACDAMAENPEKARPLHLSTQHLNGSVRLSVQDHGCGLPVDLEERIFQPFFTTKEQGLGIGLSISRSIIAAHHGQLWAERNPDHGTTFHLELRVDSPQNT